jgi:hypothetical protein
MASHGCLASLLVEDALAAAQPFVLAARDLELGLTSVTKPYIDATYSSPRVAFFGSPLWSLLSRTWTALTVKQHWAALRSSCAIPLWRYSGLVHSTGEHERWMAADPHRIGVKAERREGA